MNDLKTGMYQLVEIKKTTNEEEFLKKVNNLRHYAIAIDNMKMAYAAVFPSLTCKHRI